MGKSAKPRAHTTVRACKRWSPPPFSSSSGGSRWQSRAGQRSWPGTRSPNPCFMRHTSCMAVAVGGSQSSKAKGPGGAGAGGGGAEGATCPGHVLSQLGALQLKGSHSEWFGSYFLRPEARPGPCWAQCLVGVRSLGGRVGLSLVLYLEWKSQAFRTGCVSRGLRASPFTFLGLTFITSDDDIPPEAPVQTLARSHRPMVNGPGAPRSSAWDPHCTSSQAQPWESSRADTWLPPPLQGVVWTQWVPSSGCSLPLRI